VTAAYPGWSCHVWSRHAAFERAGSWLVSSRFVNARFPMFGLPTVYKGIQFDSRLEAKWARFFDHLGLSWLAEPKDLAAYRPDFIVNGVLLAEVKGCSLVAQLAQYVAKINRSGWQGPWVLLGEHYTIQLGHKIEVPRKADALWSEACNYFKWQWLRGKQTPRYTEQRPAFDVTQFRASTPEPEVKVGLPALTVPELPSYKLPTAPKPATTAPRLPTL
jgi:hypothetical protein